METFKALLTGMSILGIIILLIAGMFYFDLQVYFLGIVLIIQFLLLSLGLGMIIRDP
jgi:hypothetical protein